MAPRKKPNPITVDAMQCLKLLENVARASGTDTWLPMINGVLVHGDVHDGKPVLVATATDRFIIVQASIDATGETPLPEVLVPLAEVKRVVAVLKSLPKATTLLEVSSPGAGMAVFAARNASVTTEPAGDADTDLPRFVPFRELYKPREIAKGDDPARFAVAGPLLTRLAAVAKGFGEALRIQMYGPTNPAHVLMGERCRAMVMPMRMPGEVTMLPLFIPPSELKREEAKAAEREAAEVEAAKTRHPAGKKAPAKPAPARKPAARAAAPRRTRAKAAA